MLTRYTSLFVSLIFISISSFSQTPCVGGFAGIYPCDQIDMMSHIPASSFGSNIESNDIWGWTDPVDGKEYAILGLNTGTAFIDISDPINPVILGQLPTHTTNSIWRDIKVYDNHAFIVSEAGGHGMQVFDLTQLSSVVAPPVVFSETAHYAGFGKAHNIVINESTGKAYGVGTNTFSGGLHIIDISTPASPTLIGDYALDGYTHDAQVVSYTGPDSDYAGSEIAFNSNENTLTIADVTDPTDAQTISTSAYSGSAYSHQGWLTPDQRYFLLGDELDEYYGNVSNTTTYIWDCLDLDNPVMIGTYVATTAAIDHNLYTRENFIYQSNYRAGLRILDGSDIANANLSEVAFFDVYPNNDNASFNGSWSNYPYFDSGVIAVSHIEDGVFFLLPKFVTTAQTAQTTCATDDVVYDITVEEGFAGPVNLSVSGLPMGAMANFSQNNVSGATTVQLTISNLGAASGLYTMTVSGQSTELVYTADIELTVNAALVWYEDSDSDGYGNNSSPLLACSQPAGYVTDNTDCDDTNNLKFPNNPEVCDGLDNDCDGLVDNGVMNTYYYDNDLDTYGDASVSLEACSPPAGFVADNTDCDDFNAAKYPGAPSTNEGIDNDCNGLVDADEEAVCLGDYDSNGVRDVGDLLFFLADFGCMSSCAADLNNDDLTDSTDLLLFLGVFSTACP